MRELELGWDGEQEQEKNIIQEKDWSSQQKIRKLYFEKENIFFSHNFSSTIRKIK